jgi:hypothetical protein
MFAHRRIDDLLTRLSDIADFAQHRLSERNHP